jgi:hypothetical protein
MLEADVLSAGRRLAGFHSIYRERDKTDGTRILPSILSDYMNSHRRKQCQPITSTQVARSIIWTTVSALPFGEVERLLGQQIT